MENEIPSFICPMKRKKKKGSYEELVLFPFSYPFLLTSDSSLIKRFCVSFIGFVFVLTKNVFCVFET